MATSGVDLATVGLRIDGSGAVATLDRFERSADRAGRSGDRLEKTARGLRTALAAMGMALGARELIDYADSWNMLQGRVGNATTSLRMSNAVMGELFASAQRARVGIENIGDLYASTARAADQLGASQRNLLDFTETLSKGFIVSNASVTATNSAITQLGQALQSGVLQGDELRSLRENAPRLMRALAEGMGVTTGELKRLGAEGKLTSEAVFNAILSQRDKIESEFQKMPVTIGQSFNVLNNEIRRYIGGADDASNASHVVGAAIMLVAENLETLVKVLGFAVLTWASYNLVTKASAAISAAVAGWKAIVTAAAVAETAAVRADTAAIAGYETAAVSSGVASGVMAGGMTTAAGAATVLGVALRGVVAFLTGPVGIALAIASVISLLVKYKSSTLEAAGATDQFRASLAGMSKTQLLATEADLDRQIWENERLLAQAERRPTTAYVIASRVQSLLETDVGKSLPDAPTEDPAYRRLREATEALKLQREATQEQYAALSELETPINRVAAATQNMGNAGSKSARAMAEFRAGLAEMVREAEQARDASTLQGMAQAEANEHFAAANALLRMRAELQEKVFVRDAAGNVSGTLSQAQADTLYAEAQRDVARALGLRLDAENRAAVSQARQEQQSVLSDAQRELDLAFRYGDAQEKLRIHYEAVNRATEARRNLTGEALQITLETIAAEERLGQQMVTVERFAGEMADGVNDAINRIFDGTIRTIGDLFGWIKQAFTRMLAEMATDRMMVELGKAFRKVMLGDAGVRAATANANLQSMVGSIYNAGSVADRGLKATPIPLEGVVATASTSEARNREMLKKFAGYLGSALAGASLGQMFGYGSGSAVIGALGGGLSGAAAGFMQAGPAGAVIGGLAGLAGGILGAHKRHQEEQRRLRETLDRNNQRLDMLRESFDGFNLMGGKNLSLAGGLTGLAQAFRLLGGGFTGQVLARNGVAGISTKDLGEALKGGESTRQLRALEQQFGITFQQLGRIAKELGIELFDSAGKLIPAALKQLNEAIELSIRAATQFGNNLDDIRLRQEARNALFDLNGPDQKLKDAYEQLTALAPDLLKQMGLANLNLDTEAGRNVLLEGLREIFNLIQSGALTPELLGAFTDKGQLIDAILRAKAGLDAFNQSLGTVTTDFPKAMDLIIYEQRFGRGVGAGAGSGTAPGHPSTPPPRPPDTSPGGVGAPQRPITVTVYYTGTDTPKTMADKLQEAIRIEESRGGAVVGQTVAPETLT